MTAAASKLLHSSYSPPDRTDANAEMPKQRERQRLRQEKLPSIHVALPLSARAAVSSAKPNERTLDGNGNEKSKPIREAEREDECGMLPANRSANHTPYEGRKRGIHRFRLLRQTRSRQSSTTRIFLLSDFRLERSSAPFSSLMLRIMAAAACKAA